MAKPAPENRRWLYLNVLAACLFIGWFFLLPKGFPLDHPRWWANGAIPLLCALLGLVNIAGCFKQFAVANSLIPALPAVVTGLVIGCFVMYFRSLASLQALVILLPWGYFCFGAWRQLRQREASQRNVPLSAVCLAIGACWAVTQQAPAATTRPMATAFPPEVTPLSGAAILAARTYDSASCQLSIDPFLTFESTSPDGFWTLFSPGHEPEFSPRHGLTQIDKQTFTVWTEIPERIDSHLNTFTDLTVRGRADIFIEFSPCPGERFAVLPFDYPVGRPARVAFLDDQGTFKIVEASSGEKGPYRVLAKGFLSRQSPLSLKIFEGDRLAFTIFFDDFSSQCSTALSPTAGWGFPQNSILFVSMEDDTRSAFIAMNLASTSTGRGWDSVGHAPGVYRNRIRVEREP